MTALTSSKHSRDKEEDLPTVELDDPMWDKDPLPDSREYHCIHGIPRLTTPPQPHSLYQQPHPAAHQGVSAMPPQQPYQVEVPSKLELMEMDIPDDIPDLIDVPEDIVLDFEAWAHDVLSY